ncbi:MAG: hypothetical protein ACREQ9_18675, partial [Candidatus Binatia bacterium]
MPTGRIPSRALGKPAVFDRALRLFTDVRPGEGATGAALLAGVFFLLAANYFVKPARDGLLAISGIPGISDLELKAYSSFGQTLLLLVAIPVYARLSNRLERRDLVRSVSVFFISNLFVFWCLQPGLLVARIPFLGVAFYLWVGIFNVFVVAQFWSFAADLYSDDGGRRLFPAIAIGAAAGSTAGAWLSTILARAFGTFTLLPAAGVLLAASAALVGFAESRGPGGDARAAAPAPAAERPSAALRLVVRHRFLLAAAFAMLLLNWVKTNSDNLLFAVVQEVLRIEVSEQGLTDGASIDRFVGDQT